MYETPLRFRANGKFTILQMTDIQDLPSLSPDTLYLMEQVLDRVCPDLVVLTGDQIKGYSSHYKTDSQKKVRQIIRQITKPLEARSIPFAVTFGNHDRQSGVSNEKQQEIFRESPMCVRPEFSCDAGTFWFPILASGGAEPVCGVYLIDSQGNAKGGYEPVTPKQIRWYRQTRDHLEQIHQRLIPSLLFAHIPLPEFYRLLKKVPPHTKGAIRAYRTHNREWYVKRGGVDGFFYEPPSIPDENTGLFQALKERGDILSVFVGHDHNNSFSGLLDGILVGYCPGIGFSSYGPGKKRGARVFTLCEHDPAAVQTETLAYEDFGARKIRRPLVTYLRDHSPTTFDAALHQLFKVGIGLAVLLAALILLIWQLREGGTI